MVSPGVLSEVGKLRGVIVNRPDLALKRLTPDNCRELLFDDVLWVKKARLEHDAFVDAMVKRGALRSSWETSAPISKASVRKLVFL